MAGNIRDADAELFNTDLGDREPDFQKWLGEESKRRGRDMSRDLHDYDLRGYYRDNPPGPAFGQPGHMTDAYKKPNHPTFSTHSRYSGAPGGYKGGEWAPDGTSYKPSAAMLADGQHHDVHELEQYMKEEEPGVRLDLGDLRIPEDPHPNPEPAKPEGTWMGRLAAYGQGAGLGWGNRIGAAGQAAAAALTPGMSAGDTYDQALGENNQVLDRQKAAEPKLSRLLEILGGVAPSIVAGAGGKALTIGQKIGQAAKVGSALGGFGGMGSSRGDIGSTQNAQDTGIGLAAGAATGPLAEAPFVGRAIARRMAAPAQEAMAQAQGAAYRDSMGGRPAQDIVKQASEYLAAERPRYEAEMARPPKMEADMANPEARKAILGNTVAGRPRLLEDTAPAKTAIDEAMRALEDEGTKP